MLSRRWLPLAPLLLAVGIACAADSGNLALDVLGDLGAGAQNSAQVIGRDGKVVGEVRPGSSVALPPGSYKLVLPIVGGKIEKDDVVVEPGRTHTVMINGPAVMEVDVKDRNGKDPGFGVTVTSPTPPHDKIASFTTGEKFLFAPMQVDVHVDAPPQGYDWSAVALKPGQRARLTLGEVVPAELDVQTVLHGASIDGDTHVIVFRAGTQSRAGDSPPGTPHHFKLDPGDYDVYVENGSGKGHPTASVPGIHLEGGAKVEKTVPMD
ncbi:MAG TPA: hypothetical protein VMH37_11150 [Candidatus Binataceae bacterium]|nr:hypothetical protein [Candidatus Binataceae bacterium]